MQINVRTNLGFKSFLGLFWAIMVDLWKVKDIKTLNFNKNTIWSLRISAYNFQCGFMGNLNSLVTSGCRHLNITNAIWVAFETFVSISIVLQINSIYIFCFLLLNIINVQERIIHWFNYSLYWYLQSLNCGVFPQFRMPVKWNSVISVTGSHQRHLVWVSVSGYFVSTRCGNKDEILLLFQRNNSNIEKSMSRKNNKPVVKMFIRSEDNEAQTAWLSI